MASKPTTRSLQSLSRQVSRRPCSCSSSIRTFSASSSLKEYKDSSPTSRPRWSYTPPKMVAPYPLRIKDPDKAWECNSDPKRLDQFYINFLGRDGHEVLTEEVKWLAVTHKSFDQGRRGFNDRLAFFGMLPIQFFGFGERILMDINYRPKNHKPPSLPHPPQFRSSHQNAVLIHLIRPQLPRSSPLLASRLGRTGKHFQYSIRRSSA